MTVKNQLYTVADFERYIAEPANRDRLLELIEGEIIEKMPTEKHGEIVLNFGSALLIHVKQHGLGRVTTEARHRVGTDKHNDRLPDISFIAGQRPAVEKGSIPQMPDLAVEVKSPDDSVDDMREKAKYYLDNGSKMVLLLFYDKKEVEQHTKAADGTIQITTFTTKDTLDIGAVIPGFSITVKAIFDVD